MNKKAVMPPLGLLTIASMLDEHELKLIDMNVNSISDEDILWADYVFISAMITQKESAKKVMQECKRLGVKMVAGGPLFNNLQYEFSDVDHFVMNEGEVTLPLFLEDLKNGTPQKRYFSDRRPDIDSVPIPKWELINLNDYAKMPLQFSRGCPFDCEFCDIANLNGKVPRVKSPAKFMEELNALYDCGWRGAIMVVDDNFICNKAKAKELLNELIKWRKEKKYKATYVTQISLNLADDDELLVLMQKAGFSSVFIGLETPSTKSLEECGKFHNKDRDMLQDIKKIHNNGLEVYGGFIVGFDHDDHTIFDTQFKFIQSAGIVVATVGLLNALPGTKLYFRLDDENRLTNDSSGNNMDFSTNFVTKMNKGFLIEEYKKLLLSLYSVKNYYERVSNFLKDYRVQNSGDGAFTFDNLIIFFKSLFVLGVMDKNRVYFWKMFLTCIFKYPTSLPKVLSQAIYFIHYEKIYENELCETKEEENAARQLSSVIPSS
jgi:radical SAM superfamily enzyme YgiQ (UPF0313 family)